MNKPPEINTSFKKKVLPLILAFITITVCCFVLLNTGGGLVSKANAQVNLQRVGEAAAEQATEGMSRSSLDQAGEATAPTPEGGEQASGAGAEGVVLMEGGELPPGESAEVSDAAPPIVYDTSPGSPYYISCEGIDGPKLSELDTEAIRSLVSLIPDVTAAPEPAKSIMINTLVPILLRFQVMVSPPVNTDNLQPGQIAPWDSQVRRYSPFDVVGGGGPPPGPTQPIPPFQPIVRVGGPEAGPRVSAQEVAATLGLIGVVGEPGSYLAILSAPGGTELRLSVGDVVTSLGKDTFIVSEITLDAVRISNQASPDDQGLVQFTSRDGIADVSISY